MDAPKKRCRWVTESEIYRHYHDNEWGVPVRDSRRLFACLMLEGQQAGLSWLSILKRRDTLLFCLCAILPGSDFLFR